MGRRRRELVVFFGSFCLAFITGDPAVDERRGGPRGAVLGPLPFLLRGAVRYRCGSAATQGRQRKPGEGGANTRETTLQRTRMDRDLEEQGKEPWHRPWTGLRLYLNLPERRQTGQRSSAVRGLSGHLWAGGASCAGAPLQGLGPLLTNLGLELCHQLVKVLAAAHHLPPLVNGVNLGGGVLIRDTDLAQTSPENTRTK